MAALGHMLGLMSCRRAGGGGGVPPEVPENFAVAVRTDITIGVTWDALPEGAFTRIQSQPAGGDWSGAVENPVYSSGFTVVDCTADTAYDIRIRAENDGGVSDWVTLTDIYTGGMVPPSLVIGSGLYGEITVGWDGAGMAGKVDSVRIYLNGLLEADGINPIGAGHTLTGVPAGTYNVQVSSIGLTGGQEGPLSDAVPCSPGEGTAAQPTYSPSPSISFDGTTMTVNVGGWYADPASISFTYEWKRDGEPGAGYGSTLNPTSYGTYTCVVTGTNLVGSNSATSDPYSYYE